MDIDLALKNSFVDFIMDLDYMPKFSFFAKHYFIAQNKKDISDMVIYDKRTNEPISFIRARLNSPKENFIVINKQYKYQLLPFSNQIKKLYKTELTLPLDIIYTS